METKDHYFLAKYMVDHMEIKGIRKKAFLLGNLIPDVNPLTYLSLSEKKWFQGHSYHYRKKFLFKTIRSKKNNTFYEWYSIGKMMHYLTDSFTRPHNERFGYVSKKHTEYESFLHQYFKNKMQNRESWFFREREKPLKRLDLWLDKIHTEYLEKSVSVQDDFNYILSVTMTICAALKKRTDCRQLVLVRKIDNKKYQSSRIGC